MLTKRVLAFPKAFAFLIALFLLVPTAMASEAKIGYVNLQKVGNEATQAVRAMKKLRAEFEKREQEIQRLDASIKAMIEKLDKEGVTMAASERRTRERELADASRELQTKKRDFREDWSLRQNEELMLLNESVAKVIRKIAETDKYDLIVQDAVYASQAIDITARVIKAMNDANGGSTAPSSSK